LSKLKPFECDNCKSTNFTTEEIQPNRTWIHKFLTLKSIRAPPLKKQHIKIVNKTTNVKSSGSEAVIDLKKNTAKQT
jgi:hypothetical protein